MFQYSLTRSKRKTLSIRVTKDATLDVRAPLMMPLSEIEKFIAQKQAWITKAVKNIKERAESAVYITKEQEMLLRQKAKTLIPERVSYYAGIMGVTPETITITGAKKRWGSCSGKNSLNFSWRLILGDIDVVDYVVVHELSHLIERNHSKRFWAVVAKFMPDYKDRQKKLKELPAVILANEK